MKLKENKKLEDVDRKIVSVRVLYAMNNSLIFIDFNIFTFVDQESGLCIGIFKAGCTYKLVKCVNHFKVAFDPRFSYQPSITLSICPKFSAPLIKHGP